ncbi:MAG: cytochrome P450 [Ktedonobacteraceae bacterium]|nr:cytochrome P450 [Ktedonobacteraceae bacterium]
MTITTCTLATSPACLSVPGPPAMPIVGPKGNVFRFISDPVGHTSHLFKTYGPIVALAAGGGTNFYSPERNCPGTVFICGPALIRQVTTQHEIYYKYPLTATLYRKRETAPRTEPLKHVGVGLFGVNSDEHRQQRRLLMPTFHKKRIEAYRDDMVTITQQELDQWQDGEQRNICKAMQMLTMRVVTKTLFGEDIEQNGSEAVQTLQDALILLASPLTTLLPFDLPGLPYHHFLDLVGRFDGQMRAILARKRATGANGRDMLSMLIRAHDEESGATLSEDELLGHIGVFFAAGHETSANALTWTLFLLAQHPQVAADLLDELQSVLYGEAPTVEQLQHLPLLDRVVKESMRVLPPSPLQWRVTSQMTEIGGYALPSGTELIISTYQTHHMPEIYPQPKVFTPARWEAISPSVFEYNPFSAGPRMCIGASFAIMEIKIVLALLLQRYRLQCLPRPLVNRFGLMIITPKGGLPMIVQKQDRQFAHGVGGVRGNVREMVELPI